MGDLSVLELIRSSGTAAIFIHVNNTCADSRKPLILPIFADVVNSNVPLLIPQESLGEMKGSIDFGDSSLTIAGGGG